jgi:[protein-PII] uridylyltransferase
VTDSHPSQPKQAQADQRAGALPQGHDPRSSELAQTAPELLAELKTYLAIHTARTEKLVAGGGSGSGADAGMAMASVYDGMLETLFLAARGLIEQTSRLQPIALGAVGSYGRCGLAFGSDLDVRLLFEGDEQQARRVADAILYPLWDVHVPIGHQVVSADALLELARGDLRTATTLLDWRPIHGDGLLWRKVLERANAGLFSASGVADLAMGLERDTASRHERFGGTVYRLEPDIKLGPGGTRDLDIALWIARARWRIERFEDLTRVGVLVPREVTEILSAREHLWRLRNQLHWHAKRRADRLTFDEQQRIAGVFGYGDQREGVEAFMGEHYKHASAIMRARELLVERALELSRVRRPAERSIAEGIKLFDQHITFSTTEALVARPSLALRLYQEAIQRGLPLYPEARRALRRALQLQAFRNSIQNNPESRELFVALATVIQNTKLRGDSVLADMHDVGLLTAMIPEFVPLVGRVHHDAYHVLTVDMHSIAAVDRLRALARGEMVAAFPLACRLAAEIARPKVLFVAMLLHDIGKAIGRHDHAARGADIARDIALRIGLSEHEAGEVGHLVRHHLDLYHLATRRDMDDPSVIQDVARLAHGREGLRELYLLTFADVSTTHPEAMNAWKAGMLDALYVAADGSLRGDQSSAADQAARARERLDEVCRQEGENPEICRFLQTMPERYLLATSPQRMLQHARAVSARPPHQPTLSVLSTATGASAELCVVADDRPGLLAAIAAVLASNRLDILAAQIYSRALQDAASEALDVFFVRAAGGAVAEELERTAHKVQRDLQAVLDGRLSADQIVSPRIQALRTERPAPAVETQVAIDNRASADLTVVEVFTRDRPGLLYVLAATLRDLNLSIQIAKINTEGTRVADVFYVCQPDRTKLQSVEQIEYVRVRIMAVLEQLASEGS